MIENIEINNDVIVVVGPTSVGKSMTAILLAKKYNCDIISADAFQVYKKMDIGTGKVTRDEMDGVVHHFIDIVDYKTEYNVSRFQKEARLVIDEAILNGQKIIIAGGSNLFVNALLYDYNFDDDVNYDVVKKQYSEMSLEMLQSLVDINQFNNSDYNNKRRLESYLCKKKNEKNGSKILYEADFIGLYKKREELYENINNRVDSMFESGLVKEVQQFDEKFISQKAIGYKEVHQYLNGEITLEDAIDLVKKKSRNFAKRQYTWYNNKMNVNWYYLEEGIWQLVKN